MIKFMKEHNIFFKLVSIIIAFLLWTFVVTDEQSRQTRNFTVPLNVIGLESLSEQNLMLTSNTDVNITVRANGRRSVTSGMSSRDVSATIDFSTINQSGSYDMRPSLKSEKAVSELSCTPRTVTFEVENIVSKEIPVKVVTTGTLPSDRLLSAAEPVRDTVEVHGAESIVNSIAAAIVTVNLNGVSSSKDFTSEIVLQNTEGTVVTSPYISSTVQTLGVSVSLNQIVSLPLTVSLIPTSTLTIDMVESSISPSSVRVYGSKEALKNLSSLSLGSIDLGDAKSEYTMSIKLPAGVSLAENEVDKATVALTFKNDAERSLTIRSLKLEDSNSNPEKPSVTLITNTLPIRVKGSADALANLTAESFEAVINIDSSTLEDGQHNIPVDITIVAPGNFKIISDNLTATIEIVSAPAEEEPQTS